MHVVLSPLNICWKSPEKCSMTSFLLSHHSHFHDVSTNFCKQIHSYKNSGLGDEFAIELTSLDLNQGYPLDNSEYIHLLTMFELYPY